MNPQPDILIVHDGQVILEVNDAACDLFRCECGALVGRRMEQIIYSDELQTLAVWRGKHIMAQPDEREFRQSYDFVRCDGTRFWGEAISRRIEPGKYRTIIRWDYDIDR
jgi:PAS domain S-box-containing protein